MGNNHKIMKEQIRKLREWRKLILKNINTFHIIQCFFNNFNKFPLNFSINPNKIINSKNQQRLKTTRKHNNKLQNKQIQKERKINKIRIMIKRKQRKRQHNNKQGYNKPQTLNNVINNKIITIIQIWLNNMK